MKDVLLDTDVLINFLRGNQNTKDFLVSLVDDYTVYCSVITVAEIYAGMKEHEKAKTEALIESLNIVEVSKDIAIKAGYYKAKIKKQILQLDDCFIAATAFVKGATLATYNGRHYPMNEIKKIILKG